MRLSSISILAGCVVACSRFASPALAQSASILSPNTRIDSTLEVGSTHQYAFRLGAGHSISLVVTQQGVDLVVEVLDAGDSILLVMDSPNGRNGPEVVELVSPQPANYTLRVRPFDGQEPEGRYMLAVTGWRDARGTRELLAGRHRARDSAAAWLRPRSAALPGVSLTALSQPLLPLDSLAARVDVLGIGEATHGSREFGDLRLVLTRYLVERHG